VIVNNQCLCVTWENSIVSSPKYDGVVLGEILNIYNAEDGGFFPQKQSGLKCARKKYKQE